MGGNVGRLTSVGTLGSFLGTLVIGYFLIPNLPNAVSVLLTASLLVLVRRGVFSADAPLGARLPSCC